jgi:hypothetical protein
MERDMKNLPGTPEAHTGTPGASASAYYQCHPVNLMLSLQQWISSLDHVIERPYLSPMGMATQHEPHAIFNGMGKVSGRMRQENGSSPWRPSPQGLNDRTFAIARAVVVPEVIDPCKVKSRGRFGPCVSQHLDTVIIDKPYEGIIVPMRIMIARHGPDTQRGRESEKKRKQFIPRGFMPFKYVPQQHYHIGPQRLDV